ncbi:hypothetical protein N9L68_06855 [bacterium]|nr:hypothetical protein [bacterium]
MRNVSASVAPSSGFVIHGVMSSQLNHSEAASADPPPEIEKPSGMYVKSKVYLAEWAAHSHNMGLKPAGYSNYVQSLYRRDSAGVWGAHKQAVLLEWLRRPKRHLALVDQPAVEQPTDDDSDNDASDVETPSDDKDAKGPSGDDSEE